MELFLQAVEAAPLQIPLPILPQRTAPSVVEEAYSGAFAAVWVALEVSAGLGEVAISLAVEVVSVAAGAWVVVALVLLVVVLVLLLLTLLPTLPPLLTMVPVAEVVVSLEALAVVEFFAIAVAAI